VIHDQAEFFPLTSTLKAFLQGVTVNLFQAVHRLATRGPQIPQISLASFLDQGFPLSDAARQSATEAIPLSAPLDFDQLQDHVAVGLRAARIWPSAHYVFYLVK
jgi:hypothetical protein